MPTMQSTQVSFQGTQQRASNGANDVLTGSNVEEFFWARVNKSPGCWIWTGGRTVALYGRLKIVDKIVYAHRYSYMLHHGEIPEEMCICHRCDNPSCVNPDHLFLGTKKDNSQDMIRKGRHRHGRLKGEDHPTAKLTAAQVLAIRHARDVGLQYSDIALLFGICKSQVSNIVRRISWSHL